MIKRLIRVMLLLLICTLAVSSIGCGKPKTPDVSQVPNSPTTPTPSTPVQPTSPSPQPAPQPVDLSVGGWSYFQFKEGQYLKYNIKSVRGLTGWASIEVKKNDKGEQVLVCMGNWGLSEFSVSNVLKPGVNGEDFAFALDTAASNALGSLFSISYVPFAEVKWEDGFVWIGKDEAIKVSQEEEYAGVTGRVMTYTSLNAFTQKEQKRVYCINLKYPLPLKLECPAANDTWIYELAEAKGF